MSVHRTGIKPHLGLSAKRSAKILGGLFAFVAFLCAHAGQAPSPAAATNIIFDTDIGDDIDDAYALAFLLRSPEVNIVAVTTAFGDTHLRARLAERLLQTAGRSDIPVYEGPSTAAATSFTQRAWAEGSTDHPFGDAITFTLDAIRKNPGQITLLSVAPLTNVGALIAKDPATFHQLRQVVIMGGAIDRGYGNHKQADVEWNIKNDIPAAQALVASGVPLAVMPLDSTQVKLDRPRLSALFARNTAMTRALQTLTREWSTSTGHHVPTLFDAVTAAYVVQPGICPTVAMHLAVDAKGYTRRSEGPPNAEVCLKSAVPKFFQVFLPRVH